MQYEAVVRYLNRERVEKYGICKFEASCDDQAIALAPWQAGNLVGHFSRSILLRAVRDYGNGQVRRRVVADNL